MKKQIYYALLLCLLFFLSTFLSYACFKSIDKSKNNYIQIGKFDKTKFKSLLFSYADETPYTDKNKWMVDVGYDKLNSIIHGTKTKFPNIIDIKSLKASKMTGNLLLLVNFNELSSEDKNSVNLEKCYLELTRDLYGTTKLPFLYKNLRKHNFSYSNGKINKFPPKHISTFKLIDLASHPSAGNSLGLCSFRIYINDKLYDKFKINFTK